MTQETLEEAAGKYARKYALSTRHISHIGFEDGAKWQTERMYSEEEVYKMLLKYQSNYPYASNEIGLKKWFEEIKKK